MSILVEENGALLRCVVVVRDETTYFRIQKFSTVVTSLGQRLPYSMPVIRDCMTKGANRGNGSMKSKPKVCVSFKMPSLSSKISCRLNRVMLKIV